MRWIRVLAGLVADLVIGDDWVIAAGVAVALALTALLTATAIPAWWLLPWPCSGSSRSG